MSSLEEVVAYYRTALKQRGDVVFERPATYMFEVGRFRPETMAFPPGVTVKDFTWAGSAGYPEPRAQRPAGTVSDGHPDCRLRPVLTTDDRVRGGSRS